MIKFVLYGSEYDVIFNQNQAKDKYHHDRIKQDPLALYTIAGAKTRLNITSR